MATTHLRTAALVLVGLALTAAPSFAQHDRRGGDGGRREGTQRAERSDRGDRGDRGNRAENSDRGSRNRPDARAERAVPRSSERAPVVVAPRNYGRPVIVAPRGYRPSVGAYRRPYYYDYRPYGYRSYAYRPGVSLYFGLPYSAYGYSAYGAPGAYGYYTVVPGRNYGGVRIVDAPENAEVFVDGYYAGVVDDYDGVFQRLNLEPGSHHIEVEVPGEPPHAFDVRVEPGQTITYHVNSGR